jgi:hypothetical protein
MRHPQRGKAVPKQRTAIVKSYPAPVGGWNARDALASMHPADAVVLNNWFPNASYVEFRGGYALHASNLGGDGKTLMVYNGIDGTNEMFCATATDILDVTIAGAAASVFARTNAKHQWNMFGDGTNQWLMAFNGVDKPAFYNGTTWTAVDGASSPALTGVTTTTIVSGHPFKGRMLFLFNDSLKFGYLAAGAAGGAVSLFDLSGEASRGGYLIAFAHWTRDGGSGPDDFAVFFTSEGEAIVYQGTNPNSATTWAKVGTFFMGKPIGRKCVLQYGTDCIVITQDGVFPMAALLQASEAERAKISLSDKIRLAFIDAARSYGDTFGWSATVFPAHNALLVNVPIEEDGVHHQYVMNTVTKSWCKFTDWDSEDFVVFNGELYFCQGEVVFKAWTGTHDFNEDIVFYGKQAFQNFGDPLQKHCQLFMPFLSVNGNVAYGADIDVDFEDDEITGTVSYTVTSGGSWDVSNWDESFWASNLEVVKQWSSPSEWEGIWISTKIKIASNSLICQWMGSTLIYDRGEGI